MVGAHMRGLCVWVYIYMNIVINYESTCYEQVKIQHAIAKRRWEDDDNSYMGSMREPHECHEVGSMMWHLLVHEYLNGHISWSKGWIKVKFISLK